MAYTKKKKMNPKPHQRKTQQTQPRRKKPPAKQGTKTRSKQGKKHVKGCRGMTCNTAKNCHLTKQARGVMSSCLEGICKKVSSEANRMRKKIREPTISHEVLLAALEKSMEKENNWYAMTKGTKKKKKNLHVDTTQKAPSATKKQAAQSKIR